MYTLVINVEGKNSSSNAAHAVAAVIAKLSTIEAKINGPNGQWIVTSNTKACLGKIQTWLGRTEGGVRSYPCVIFCRD